ncbi:MAG: hypothetical protein LBL21_02210 [Rickettsiales bacterium]|jgi:hypothetical protein|nr:hypothetical protein [Rickettsiales bacterium]
MSVQIRISNRFEEIHHHSACRGGEYGNLCEYRDECGGIPKDTDAKDILANCRLAREFVKDLESSNDKNGPDHIVRARPKDPSDPKDDWIVHVPAICDRCNTAECKSRGPMSGATYAKRFWLSDNAYRLIVPDGKDTPCLCAKLRRAVENIR